MTSLHVICGPPPIKNPGYAYAMKLGCEFLNMFEILRFSINFAVKLEI